MKTESGATRREFLNRSAGTAAAVGVGGYLALAGADSRRRTGRKIVRFWHQLGGEWLEPLERAVARFNESQGRYEVQSLLLAGTEMEIKLLLGVAGGDPPDVSLVWSQITSEWAESHILQPLDPWMTPEEKRHLTEGAYPVVARSGRHKGSIYGITMGFDLWVVYYRTDHFREAGLDPDHFPETLEEMTALSEHLHRFDSTKTLTRAGFIPQALQNYAPLFDGRFYDPQTDRLTLHTPENLRALTYMVETRKKLGLERLLRFQAGLATDSGASWPFISGSYSITVDGEWRVEQLRRYAPHLEYRTVPVPPPKGGKPLSSFSMINYLIMPQGAREPEGAWEFIKYWTGLDNPERAAEFFPWYGWMPLFPKSARTPVYESWLQTVPNYRTFLRVAESENIVTTPPVPYQSYLMDRLLAIDQLAMRGTLTPEQALLKWEADIAQEKARRRRLGYAE